MTVRKKKKTRSKKTTALARVGDGNLPTTLRDELDSYLSRDAASATGGIGWASISTQGARFTFNQDPMESPIDVVILGAMRMNLYYPGAFDATAMSGPSCYALDLVGDEQGMAPPADLESREHDVCRTCVQNAFGSDDRGRGKACKNTVRLVLLPWEPGQDLSRIEGARLSVPPTSLANWSSYARKIVTGMERPLFTVVSTIAIEPDSKTQMKLRFNLAAPIGDDETLRALLDRAKVDGVRELEQPPAIGSAEPEKPKRIAVKKTPRKKAARKTRRRAANAPE